MRNQVKFCSYLTGDINFEPASIQPCCNTRGLDAVPSLPFTGGRVDIAAYTEHIHAAFNALQNGGPLCSGCPNLLDVSPDTVRPVSRENILFRTVSMNQHRHLCNCRCVYCTLWQKSSPSYAILPALKSLWQQQALSRNCFFSWGGGEPSILREFEEASRWILAKGFQQYVHTNALRYSPTIAEVLASGKGGVNVSLDSANPETYKAVKGIDGFARVAENLRRYIDAATVRDAVHVKYIIFALNNQLDAIDAFFNLCRDLGVTNVQFSFDFREVNNRELSDASLEAALLFMHNAGHLNMMCTPFFVDDIIMRRLENLAQSL